MSDLTANDSNTPANKSGDGIQYVMLPCEPKHFRGFIAGLLGQPQTTSGYVDGVFRVNMHDIVNVCHLVTQRVSKQNDSSLIHIAIAAHYSDGNSVTHNTLKAFESYHQTTNSHPIAISISFSYLIKFIDREHPEKQEVSILLTTDAEFRHETRPKIWFQSGLFSFQITHTEITWATDIAGLLKNHANSIIDKSSGMKKFFSRHADEMLGYWCSFVFLGMLAVVAFSATELHRNGSISTVQDATRYLSVTACIVLGLVTMLGTIERFFSFHIHLRSPSFIVLTEKDKEHVAKVERKQRNAWIAHGVGWAAGLASGVLSNHIYALLTKTLVSGN